MKPNLTERQTNRIATLLYRLTQDAFWNAVNTVLKDDDTELSDQDFINISKELAELLHDTN
jgi:hypothetical protein